MNPSEQKEYTATRFQIRRLIEDAYRLKFGRDGTREELIDWYVGTLYEDASDDQSIDFHLKHVPRDQHERVRKKIADAQERFRK
jgi:hypothetical protein